MGLSAVRIRLRSRTTLGEAMLRNFVFGNFNRQWANGASTAWSPLGSIATSCRIRGRSARRRRPGGCPPSAMVVTPRRTRRGASRIRTTTPLSLRAARPRSGGDELKADLRRNGVVMYNSYAATGRERAPAHALQSPLANSREMREPARTHGSHMSPGCTCGSASCTTCTIHCVPN